MRKRSAFRLIVLVLNVLTATSHLVLDLELDLGAIPNDSSPIVVQHNTKILQRSLGNQGSNNTILVAAGKNIHLYHGVSVDNLENAIIQIDGALRFERNESEVISKNSRHPAPCLYLRYCRNVTFTSLLPNGQRGVIDGNGPQWWGIPFLGYVELQEHRPVLFQVKEPKNLLVENLVFLDAPLWTMKFYDVDGLKIRQTSIISRRTNHDGHSLVDLSAFNTDGIDVGGTNVHVHDVDIWNQDDCIAVKDSATGISSNMLFERINASGVGMTIGSIGGTTVQNITFRDSYLHKSVKGIYLKFRQPGNPDDKPGLIQDVTFENIIIEEPQQYGMWLGPAQQADSRNVCTPNPCSLCWPALPFAQCNTVNRTRFVNITFKNVSINNPTGTPGVIMGDGTNGIEGLVFDNVLVTQGPPLEGERLVAFPGLKEPWNDDNAHRGHVLWACGVAIVAFTTFCIICRCIYKSYKRHFGTQPKLEDVDGTQQVCRTTRPRKFASTWCYDDEDANPKPQESKVSRCCCRIKLVMFMLVLTPIAIVTCHAVSVSRTLYDTSEYFVCQGVVHAEARGNTWPIPSCFDDKTSLGTPYGGYRMQLYRQDVMTAIIVLALVSICTLCSMLMCHAHKRLDVSRNRCNYWCFDGSRNESKDFEEVSIEAPDQTISPSSSDSSSSSGSWSATDHNADGLFHEREVVLELIENNRGLHLKRKTKTSVCHFANERP